MATSFDLAMASQKNAMDFAQANFKGGGDYQNKTLQNQFDEVKRQSEQFDANRNYESQQRQGNHDFTMRNPGFNSGIGTTDIKNVFGGDKNTTFTYSNPVSQQPNQTQSKPTIESSAKNFNQIINSTPAQNVSSGNSNSQENKLLTSDNSSDVTNAVNNEAQSNLLIGSQNNSSLDSLSSNQNNKPKNYFDPGYFSR